MITVSCPGSINILGEHALIRGGQGIRLAVNRFVTVSVQTTQQSGICISSRLGDFSGTLTDLNEKPAFSYITQILTFFNCDGGLQITIEDDLPSDVGLGSSAAVSTALVKAISQLNGREMSKAELLSTVKTIVKKSQSGIGSGIDVAASVYGGMVLYDPKKEDISALPLPPGITILTSGVKVPTARVVQHVNGQNHPESLFQEMMRITVEGAAHAKKENWHLFGQSMLAYNDCMKILKLNTDKLDELQKTLTRAEGVYGAKIAGAGLGDSVIGIGAQGHDDSFKKHPAFVRAEAFCYAG